VSLFGLALLPAIAIGVTDGRLIQVQHGTVRSGGPLWTVVFLVVSLGGAALWLVPGVRRALSPQSDPAAASAPAGRPGSARIAGAIAGLGGSSVLAAVGGVLLAATVGVGRPDAGVDITLTALAAALLGGVSVFGRRAGVAGTALAVILLVAVEDLLLIHGLSAWWQYLAIAFAVLVGLVVTWLLDLIGRSLDSR
jgi:hypothetical protein